MDFEYLFSGTDGLGDDFSFWISTLDYVFKVQL